MENINSRLKKIEKDLEFIRRYDEMLRKGALSSRCWLMFQEDKIKNLLENIRIIEKEMKEISIGKETENYITFTKSIILEKKRSLYHII